MKKRMFLAAMVMVFSAAIFMTGCGKNQDKQEQNGQSGTDTKVSTSSDHLVITMNAPYRNMSTFVKLVQEQYPEINLEVIPYNGQNTSAYMKDMRKAGEMTDIYFTTYYTPGRQNDKEDFLELSGYDFTGNYIQSRLREVTLDGGIYMLPLGYNALGITYNKTLLEKNGWTLPTNLTELAALKSEVEKAGYTFCIDQLQYPGFGFQYLCNIANTGYLSTIDGLQWQEAFLRGETTVSDTPELVETLQLLDKWREIGVLNAEGTPDDDSQTKETMLEGNTLFLLGNSNDLTGEAGERSVDEFRLMPYLSEDGKQNVFMINVSRYVGLNSSLGEKENEQKLEDALHVLELISTPEGMQALDPSQVNSRLLPLKDATISEDSYYADVVEELNSGHTASYIYSGWENIVVALGEEMIAYVRGEATLDDVVKCFDENQDLITEDKATYYTTATENIDNESCAKLVGICFAQATGAEAALISTNPWRYDLDAQKMNQDGVSGSLFPLPISDEEIVTILPTGWRNNIETVTLSGKRIKELAETGYERSGNSVAFPYVLVTKEGMELDDETAYTVVICGATDEVKEEGNIQNTGILGLTAAEEYLSQFDTLSQKDIVWE